MTPFTKKEYAYIPGKIIWCKHKIPEAWEDDRFWSIIVYPNDEGKQVIKKLKEPPAILNVMKKDDDGEYMKFKRPCQKDIKGRLVTFDNPIVLDRDGQPFDGMVGNGSDGVVKLLVYKYRQGKGRAVRWESVRIDNLIPYERERDMPEEQQLQIKGLDQQPQQPMF